MPRTSSFGKIAGRIRALGTTVPGGIGQGLRVAGEAIMTDTKASRPGKGVPRDTGALAGSGRVSGPFGGAGDPRVRLAFGGAAAPYALRQHEILTYRHTVGEARYLIRAVERFAEHGFDAVKMALKENAEAGIRAAAAA